jgi:hypothetical protein
VYTGEVVDYDAVALRWRVVFDHGPRQSCVVDARCIRKYGPEGMRLCMRAGGGAPDTQLQRNHQVPGPGLNTRQRRCPVKYKPPQTHGPRPR